MLLLAYLHPFLPVGSGILCPLRAATGVPCPLCGMTTSVVAAAHLDLASSLAANPMGVVAVGFALYLLVGRPDRLVVSMPLASITWREVRLARPLGSELCRSGWSAYRPDIRSDMRGRSSG